MSNADMKEFLDLLKMPSTVANQVVECNKMEKTKKGLLHQEFVGEFNDRKITVIIDRPFKDDEKQPKNLLFKTCLLSIKLMPPTVLEKYSTIRAALTQQVLDDINNDTSDQDAVLDEAEEVLENKLANDAEDDDDEDGDEVPDDEVDEPDADSEEMVLENGIPEDPAPTAPLTPLVPAEEPEKPAKRSRAKKVESQSILNTPHL
jgi:hypothetical protein